MLKVQKTLRPLECLFGQDRRDFDLTLHFSPDFEARNWQRQRSRRHLFGGWYDARGSRAIIATRKRSPSTVRHEVAHHLFIARSPVLWEGVAGLAESARMIEAGQVAVKPSVVIDDHWPGGWPAFAVSMRRYAMDLFRGDRPIWTYYDCKLFFGARPRLHGWP